MIVTATADSSYINYLRVFVQSTFKYNPQYKFIVQLVDCDDDIITEFEDLGCVVNSITPPFKMDMTKKFIKQDDAEGLANYQKGVLTPEVRKRVFFSAYECFCTHARFPFVADLLRVFAVTGEDCIVADADTIVRSKLDFVENALETHELCMRYDDTGTGIEFVNEGFIAIKNTPITRRFFTCVAEIMSDPASSIDWNYDTHALTKAYAQYPEIDLFKLPVGYKDSKLNDESVIWSGSSLVKDEIRYKKEMALYR